MARHTFQHKKISCRLRILSVSVENMIVILYEALTSLERNLSEVLSKVANIRIKLNRISPNRR